MPAPVSPVSSFSPNASVFSREAGTPPNSRPAVGHAGASSMATRNGVLSERDVMTDLEPHWVAAIDAATD
jgi:hypothetical protein